MDFVDFTFFLVLEIHAKKNFRSFQVQEMIQAALDALPESEDIDMKSSSIKGNEDLHNGDSGSQMSGPAKLGCSPIDTALCLVADEMFMSID